MKNSIPVNNPAHGQTLYSQGANSFYIVNDYERRKQENNKADYVTETFCSPKLKPKILCNSLQKKMMIPDRNSPNLR